jgi:hypothetical protein
VAADARNANPAIERREIRTIFVIARRDQQTPGRMAHMSGAPTAADGAGRCTDRVRTRTKRRAAAFATALTGSERSIFNRRLLHIGGVEIVRSAMWIARSAIAAVRLFSKVAEPRAERLLGLHVGIVDSEGKG